MDFEIPKDLQEYLAELDEFIEREIKPLEEQDDNIRFFDHRREDSRTDWDRGGLPNEQWELLLREARNRADKAGHYRYPFPKEYGGQDGTNLGMAIIREHLARKGLGLHCDLQNEHAIVGNNVGLLLMIKYGTEEQKKEWIDDLAEGRRGFAFGITEPNHGSDATWMETTAVRSGDEWIINGEKTFNTGIHRAQYDMIMARTSGKAGDGDGITAFLTPTNSDGFEILEYLWTFNMPTDHAHIRLTDVHVPHCVDLRRRGTRAPGRPGVLQREPHPAGGVQPRRRAVLHQPSGRVRAGARAVRQAARDQPGDPVPARGTADAVRDAARADPQDGLVHGRVRRVLRVRQGVDVQLLGEPVVLRSGRPRDPGARRARLHAPDAVRAHLPAPPPLPDHRRQRGDPDAPDRRLHVRLHEAARAEGRGRGLGGDALDEREELRPTAQRTAIVPCIP